MSNGNILLIARHYWPRPGAATGRLTRFAQTCAERGYRLHVATGSVVAPQSGPHDELLIPFTPDRSDQSFPWRAANLVRAGLDVRHHRTLHQTRFEAVVSDPPSNLAAEGLRIAREQNIPFTFYFADSWAAHVRGTGGRVKEILAARIQQQEQRIFGDADGVITVHAEHHKTAKRLNSRTMHLPNGVDTNVFTYRPPAESACEPYFIYPGNYGALHGAQVFLRGARLAWQRGSRFRMVFVGYGSASPEVQELQRQFPDRFEAREPVRPERAAELIQGAIGGLASVAPERAYEDLLPVKAMAAATTGCPLIFAGGGTFAQRVIDERLGDVAAFDDKAVAQALINRVANPWPPHQREELSRRACERFSNVKNGEIILDYVLDPAEQP